MIVKGFYRFIKDGAIKNAANVRFESTGEKNDAGKVIWRRLRKDGKPSNIFAEQFIPDVPWLTKGKWFCKVDGGSVLRKYPHLKLDTDMSRQMSHDEYCRALSEQYET